MIEIDNILIRLKFNCCFFLDRDEAIIESQSRGRYKFLLSSSQEHHYTSPLLVESRVDCISLARHCMNVA